MTTEYICKNCVLKGLCGIRNVMIRIQDDANIEQKFDPFIKDGVVKKIPIRIICEYKR